MTKRTIIIEIDSSIGNKMYWLIKDLMATYPWVFEEEETEQ